MMQLDPRRKQGCSSTAKVVQIRGVLVMLCHVRFLRERGGLTTEQPCQANPALGRKKQIVGIDSESHSKIKNLSVLED